jgi:hypothetical protein
MLDLMSGPIQSTMSATFTWLSLIATVLEVLYRVRCYLRRRAQRTVVRIKPPRRRRALARSTRRSAVSALPARAPEPNHQLQRAILVMFAGLRR